MEIKKIEELNKVLNTIPGISKKQADRMSNFLLNQNTDYINNLINKIQQLKEKVSFCQKCNFIVEDDKCLNCDRSNLWNILIIVESSVTVQKIDQLNFFNGYYFVIPYLMKIKKQINKDIDYEYKQLIDFAKNHKIEEAVIVISPTLEGSMTTQHIFNLLKKNNIKATKAAIGLPMGSSVEYLDGFTIKQSIENRTK